MLRYLSTHVLRDLERKMVLLSGARQVGKTTLALELPGAKAGYLNWDVPEHRERILVRELPPNDLWIFDEIHKYGSWRDYLKGLYDTPSREARILVTGSARLDYCRYSGDSLQGRYHLLRLHPLSVAELELESTEDFEVLLKLGGFPEPYYSGSEVEARRWSREYRNLLIHEEITALEQLKDLGNLELLALRLPQLVGSTLSINALREDLIVSHATVQNWIAILERLFAVFRLPPLGSPRIRALQKTTKHYHTDWSLVPDEGARFENLVGCHLHKWVQYQQDTQGLDLELRYFRDQDGREVDFIVSDAAGPQLAVECKLSQGPVDKNLLYFKRKFPECAAWQIHARGTKDFFDPRGIRVAPALVYLRTLT